MRVEAGFAVPDICRELGVSNASYQKKMAGQAFRISESCYRYERKLDAENAKVTIWLIQLTDNHRTRGFGLCNLYLRNLRGFKWNHKRVLRVYKDLDLT